MGPLHVSSLSLGSFRQRERDRVMLIFGSILFWAGLVVWIAGEVRLLVVAYRQSLAWFFGCLFVPFVSWVFFLLNVKQAWKPVVMAAAGFIATGIGDWLGGFQHV